MRSASETRQRIIKTLVRRGVDHSDAEDFAQEAMLRLELAKGKQADLRSEEAFAVRASINISIDDARRRKRWSIGRQPIEELTIADDSPLPDQVLEGRRRLGRLEAGFAALDERTRSIVMGQKIHGLSLVEIAKQEGLTVGAIEKRLAKGMIFLMAWMDETSDG